MNQKPAVWIDFENAPHVWVLSGVIDHLRAQGYPVILTARDFSCTVGLAQRLGYPAQVVGRPGPAAGKAGKALRLVQRATALAARLAGRRGQIGLAISHGSRSQILAARLLGVRTISLDDYEYSDQSLVRFVDHLLVPFPIPTETWGRYAPRVVHYPGLKEELYLCRFRPSGQLPDEVAGRGRVRVLFRPEGRFAHYRSAQSETTQAAVLSSLAGRDDVLVVLLPRDAEQGRVLADFCAERHIACWTPGDVLDGPSLIWQMDLVAGGGGTMTREAAALGVPSYSFFAGQWGAVDRYLETQGRLVRLTTAADVARMRVAPRGRDAGAPTQVPDRALAFVTRFIEDALHAC